MITAAFRRTIKRQQSGWRPTERRRRRDDRESFDDGGVNTRRKDMSEFHGYPDKKRLTVGDGIRLGIGLVLAQVILIVSAIAAVAVLGGCAGLLAMLE